MTMPGRRVVKAALLLSGIALSACPTTSFAAVPPVVSSAQLVEDAEYWDGREVTFEGEVIGDVMVRGSRAWLHVNDDAYSALPVPAGARPQGYNSGHAVLAPATEAAEVRVFGSYRARGDIVRVTGIFRASDPAHGGDMLIEARHIEVVEPGFAIARPVPRWKLELLGVLVPLATLPYAARRYRASAASR